MNPSDTQFTQKNTSQNFYRTIEILTGANFYYCFLEQEASLRPYKLNPNLKLVKGLWTSQFRESLERATTDGQIPSVGLLYIPDILEPVLVHIIVNVIFLETGISLTLKRDVRRRPGNI
jgi:hypothetical protein